MRHLPCNFVINTPVDPRAVPLAWRHRGRRHARPHAVKNARETVQGRLGGEHRFHFVGSETGAIEIDKETMCALDTRKREHRFYRARPKTRKIELSHKALCVQFQPAGVLIGIDTVQQRIDSIGQRGRSKTAEQLNRLIKRIHLDIEALGIVIGTLAGSNGRP